MIIRLRLILIANMKNKQYLTHELFLNVHYSHETTMSLNI